MKGNRQQRGRNSESQLNNCGQKGRKRMRDGSCGTSGKRAGRNQHNSGFGRQQSAE